jgi:hypothetical protein
MRTDFVKHKAEAHFEPFNHLANQIPLDQGVTSAKNQAKAAPNAALAKAWSRAKLKMFAGKSTKPDSEDPDTVNHMNWYEATNYQRPYPGEKKVRWPSEFARNIEHPKLDLDD